MFSSNQIRARRSYNDQIYATAAPLQLEPDIQQCWDTFINAEAIDCAMSAATRAYRDLMNSSAKENIAMYAASAAYCANLPKFESRSNAQAYISAVALGLEMEFISLREAKQLIWTACLWLASDRQEQCNFAVDEPLGG